MSQTIRIAATGDVHADEEHRDRIAEAFARVAEEADVVLLAGDLTTLGEPEQAAVLADACRPVSIPIYAVLGNHDLHSARHEEVAAAVTDGNVRLIDRLHAVEEVRGVELGLVGGKGFVGGFGGSRLPDFGEPLLREVYAETSAEVAALERGLQAVAHCPLRVVLLHYAPVVETLAGEPEGIWAFLGSERLAGPIAEYRPDLVLHGHAHAGSYRGAIGSTPVYNVAVHVTGRDFSIFELEGPAEGAGELPAGAQPT